MYWIFHIYVFTAIMMVPHLGYGSFFHIVWYFGVAANDVSLLPAFFCFSWIQRINTDTERTKNTTRLAAVKVRTDGDGCHLYREKTIFVIQSPCLVVKISAFGFIIY
jgi:hypothetical protein